MQNQNEEIHKPDSTNINSQNSEKSSLITPSPTTYGDLSHSSLTQSDQNNQSAQGEQGDQRDAVPTANPASPAEATLTWGTFLRETLQVILPALVLAVIIHMFLAQATIVYGSSMQPVLIEKQRLVVDKITYRFREPKRNDIIVLDLDDVDEMLVKRVIGLPGETLDIRGGNIYVNNEPLREQLPHVLSSQLNTFKHPVELGPSDYYVLGDNRSNSNDSRAFGAIQRSEIVGKIWLRYWPFTEFKLF